MYNISIHSINTIHKHIFILIIHCIFIKNNFMKGRLFLYPKDLEILTGKHIITCRKMFNTLLDAFGKTRLQGLSIKEYSNYTNIPEQQIQDALNIK